MNKNEEAIEKVKSEIKILQKKLALLEELSQTKSLVEEAFKDAYGKYPVKEVSENLTSEDNWNVISWSAFQKGYERAQQDDYPYKKYTPEETAESLREAFREAQQTEKWKEIQNLIDEEDNDKNFKNSLDLIKEWGEKNKPRTLYQLIEDWWRDVFCANSTDDMETCINGLVDKIDKEFIPPSSEKNGYVWEKCLKIMRYKLR